jgi:hypothetical protein
MYKINSLCQNSLNARLNSWFVFPFIGNDDPFKLNITQV